jgi:cation diffusion facilitator family transporter
MVARRTDSLALLADAHHLSVDVWTSLGVVAGLAAVRLTGQAFFDPVVALVIALFIIRTAWGLTRDALAPLIDSVLPEAEVRAVENVMKADARVLGFHKLRTRKSGSQRHVDVHIQVDDELTLREAHALTEELEDRVRDVLPNAHVMIHTEPYEEERRHHQETPH